MASFKVDETIFDKLADVLKKHNLSEIEYQDGDTKIKISAKVPQSDFVQYSIPKEIQAAPVSGSVQTQTEPNSNDLSKHPGAFKSPMVGTCYLSPEPGARQFIEVGDSVSEGQTILLIEAMKVMNAIKTPKSGKIIHIAIKDSDPVEFGQLLVVIE